MAEYSPSKIIKDGNTYNFRDTTKIPLAGSNAISGSLIPATTNAYDLGSSSYQWNNAYIKSLTINGVACGDILTHNASEFVDVTTNQTVGGGKIFSHGQTGVGRDIYHFATIPYSKNTPPASTSFQYIWFGGNTASQGFTNNWWGGYLEQVVNTDGSVRGRWAVRRTDETSVSVEILAGADDTLTFRPTNGNQMQLGDSTHAWKDCKTKAINGINPGALSLPIASSGINLDLTNFKIDGSDNKFRLTYFSNYPYDNGWLFIRLNGCIYYYLDHWYKVVSNSYATPCDAIFFLPINDKEHDITLRCVCTSINYIRIFPCQGNV